MQKKLSALAVGQKAIIRSLEDEELVLKLMEMGFLPGEEITVEQIAPLGDPISVYGGRIPSKPAHQRGRCHNGRHKTAIKHCFSIDYENRAVFWVF